MMPQKIQRRKLPGVTMPDQTISASSRPPMPQQANPVAPAMQNTRQRKRYSLADYMKTRGNRSIPREMRGAGTPPAAPAPRAGNPAPGMKPPMKKKTPVEGYCKGGKNKGAGY